MVAVSNRTSKGKTPHKNKKTKNKDINKMSPAKASTTNKNTPGKNKNIPNKNTNTLKKNINISNTPQQNTLNKNKTTPNKAQRTPKKIISKIEENSDEMSEEESDEENLSFSQDSEKDIGEDISFEENENGDNEDEDVYEERHEENENSDDEDEDDYGERHEENEKDNDEDDYDERHEENEKDNDDDDDDEDEKEEEKITTPTKTVKRKNTKKDKHVPLKKLKTDSIDSADRTIFVGNVACTTKKWDIKKFFTKFGPIESLRFRGIPQIDPRDSKKVVLNKKKFNPNQETMLCYIVFRNQNSTEKALKANGDEFNGHNLRVDLANNVKNKELDKKKSIFIGNLPIDVEDKQVRSVFANCGNIVSIRLIRDKNSRIGKGIGYVNFDTVDAVELALQMEDVQIAKREIRISRNIDRTSKEARESTISKKVKKQEYGVYICNVPKDANREKIYELFKHLGTIVKLRLKLPGKKPKGYGYVNFANADAMNAALEMETVKLGETEIIIRASSKDRGHKLTRFTKNSSIFLYNLPKEKNEEEKKENLNRLFAKCGEIKVIQLFPGKSYGFLEFANPTSVEKALELKNLKLEDHEINVRKFVESNKKNTTKVGFKKAKKIFRKKIANAAKQQNDDSPSKAQGGKGGFQGTKFTDKKKKTKVNKTELKKKKIIKVLVQKSK